MLILQKMLFTLGSLILIGVTISLGYFVPEKNKNLELINERLNSLEINLLQEISFSRKESNALTMRNTIYILRALNKTESQELRDLENDYDLHFSDLQPYPYIPHGVELQNQTFLKKKSEIESQRTTIKKDLDRNLHRIVIAQIISIALLAIHEFLKIKKESLS